MRVELAVFNLLDFQTEQVSQFWVLPQELGFLWKPFEMLGSVSLNLLLVIKSKRRRKLFTMVCVESSSGTVESHLALLVSSTWAPSILSFALLLTRIVAVDTHWIFLRTEFWPDYLTLCSSRRMSLQFFLEILQIELTRFSAIFTVKLLPCIDIISTRFKDTSLLQFVLKDQVPIPNILLLVQRVDLIENLGRVEICLGWGLEDLHIV